MNLGDWPLLTEGRVVRVDVDPSAVLAQAGGTPQSLDVEAKVSLGPDPAGGFRLTGIAITVRGEVDGLSADEFLKAAEDAKATCPVSKALTGVDITLDAALES